ncbi:hypothetical protein HGI30_20025 [Paenibacillus albicereus]|uniref:Uncharacterized protein n=1 Tax=Paenibacillus albicereus TaxID=2726185 RepID=A0A6H2H1S9_9BACL|nr:hypothetical protein [Paenibacillus albicereus]QJC53595.1 hypothetical protein HGI30_20025 [Paenibacillus albicereus]
MKKPRSLLSDEQIRLINENIHRSNKDAGVWLNEMLGLIYGRPAEPPAEPAEHPPEGGEKAE